MTGGEGALSFAVRCHSFLLGLFNVTIYRCFCGIGGVRILIKEELCEKVVDVRRKSGRVMMVVLPLESS